MIRRVHFANFRALRDVTLDLGPFTVLVGPNASGKTSVLEALQSHYAFQPSDSADGDAARITFTLGDDTTVTRTTDTSPLGLTTALAHFDLREMRAQRQVQQAWQLDREGANLVNVFATLPRPVQERVATGLARLVPTVRDVHTRPATKGYHRFVFQDRWDESRWYEPAQVSDGTVYALGYLVLQQQRARPAVLCVDEPERSLHPYLTGRIVELLRGLTASDKPVQVVVATQSAELLEHVQPSEVRFFGRDDQGNVTIAAAPVDDPGWEEAVEEYSGSIGQMWLSGGLGGVPAV